VRETRVVQSGERGQKLEQQAEARVEPRHDPVLGGGVEDVGQAASRHVLGHDNQPVVGVLFDAARTREALVVEGRDDRDAIGQGVFEGAELGAEDQPLEHVPGLAVEREHTSAETVFIAGRRLGRHVIRGGDRHIARVLTTLQPAHHRATGAHDGYRPQNSHSSVRCATRRHLPITDLYAMSPSCKCDKVRHMADATEIEALKASMRGARTAADALSDIAGRVEAIDSHTDVPPADLDDLQRLTLANALAAQALRGLVETMLRRRGKAAAEAVEVGESDE
jgi:hypothetical protein